MSRDRRPEPLNADGSELALGWKDGSPPLAVPPMKARPESASARTPRVRRIDRRQIFFRTVDIELLVGEDHPVRAIWAFVERLELSRFYEGIEAVEGTAGRRPWDPQLLICLWIWAYSQGIGSAREISRRCGFDPAFQWLTAMEVVNYHTLSDFRVQHKEALDELFAQILGVLTAEGLVTLERVMHDGTRIRACASADTFRREERLQAYLAAARDQIRAMGEPGAEENCTRREHAARKRAARQREQQVLSALQELECLRQNQASGKKPQDVRVSHTEPEARVMKMPEGGFAPAYNAQLSTDAANGIIVGVGVTQSGSDSAELPAAVDRIEANTGKTPDQAVVDGGFTNRATILEMDRRQIDLVGSFPDHNAQAEGQMHRRGIDPAFYPSAFVYVPELDTYCCPAGCVLRHDGREKRCGVVHHIYRAAAADCTACACKSKCCPQSERKGRSVVRAEEHPVVAAFLDKMNTEEAKGIYRQRGRVAEFPNAWIKAKIGLRQFHLRGLDKVGMEVLWVCLTYNIQQWIRLCWRPFQSAAGNA